MNNNITAKMIPELPPSGYTVLLHILNATLRLEYWPSTYKLARVIMIPKPDKTPTDITSYRPISLLPVISKILERILLRRINADVQEWIPEHQFGFCKAHTTIQQCHRLANNINHALEAREFCTAVFLDISQAFDKVWHPGLLLKLITLPPSYHNIFKSYLLHRKLRVAYNSALSAPIQMKSGVPQGSVLGPFLYALYTADFPQQNTTVLSTFADDTAILSRHMHITEAISNLQTHLLRIEEWSNKWRMQINESKSKHATFTLRKGNIPHLYFNQQPLPQADTVKYLGLHFDRRLNWKHHITQTRKHLNHKTEVYIGSLGSTHRSPCEIKPLFTKRSYAQYGHMVSNCGVVPPHLT